MPRHVVWTHRRPLAFVLILRRSVLLSALVGCSEAFTDWGDDISMLDSGGQDSATDSGTPIPEVVVSGVVTDAAGLPMAGVLVTSPLGATTTGVAGDFLAPMPLTGGTIRFTRGGHHPVSRTFPGVSKAKVRLAMLPLELPSAVDVAAGTTLTHPDGSSLTIPALSLGNSGLATARFSPLAIGQAGAQASPNNRGAAGELSIAYGAVLVELIGVDGQLSPAAPLTVSLTIKADQLGGRVPVLRDDGAGWIETGLATVTGRGDGYIATFDIDQSGMYAVGHLVDGCATGQVLDANGSPIEGARVRSYLRQSEAGVAGWLDDASSEADGRFTLLAPSLGADFLAENTAADGIVTLAYMQAAGSGTTTDPSSCAELGSLTLSAAGCMTASVFAADASRPPPTPFSWGEGDISYSDAEGTLTVWARPGIEHTLSGPGGYTRTFLTSAGTSPVAGDCSRLGNIQISSQCVTVMAQDFDGAALPGTLIEGGVSAVVTGTDATTCVAAQSGTAPFVATTMRGAQRVTAEQPVTVESSGGTCFAGECTEGPSFMFGEPGCVTGTVYDDEGEVAAGIRVTSSAFDWVDSDSEGQFSLATGGTGTAAIWSDDREIVWFADLAGGECAAVELYSRAGELPLSIVATADAAFRIERDGTVNELFSLTTGWPSGVQEIDVNIVSGQMLAMHDGTTPYISGIDGTGFALFREGLWSAGRISPNGNDVALQGYGSSNPAISIFGIDGTFLRQISTSAGIASEGLGWSGDGVWVASTRADNGIEVAPSSAARGPTKIANENCTYPTWWDIDTVALQCDGAIKLIDMDASRTLNWFDSPDVDDRVRDIMGTRVLYTSGESLIIASIDNSDSVPLYTGSPGTTFDDVQFDSTGTWIMAIVSDPLAGSDVLVVTDQIPYPTEWLTNTPEIVEVAASWAE